MEQGHICGDCGYSAGLAFQVKKKITFQFMVGHGSMRDKSLMCWFWYA